jgi:hypothetical protein
MFFNSRFDPNNVIFINYPFFKPTFRKYKSSEENLAVRAGGLISTEGNIDDREYQKTEESSGARE